MLRTTQLAPHELRRLLQEPEGPEREFKTWNVSPAVLSREVAALSNTQGGQVYVGIEETPRAGARWAGSTDVAQVQRLVQACDLVMSEQVELTYELLTATGQPGCVLVVDVPASPTPVTAADGKPYLRAGERVIRLSGGGLVSRDAMMAEAAEAQRKPTPKPRPRVFISYSHEDGRTADAIATALRERTIGVWYDQWEILPGQSITERISEGLGSCNYLVVLLSPASVASRWVRFELEAAMQSEVSDQATTVIPVMLADCTVPLFLADRQYVDFRHDMVSGVAELAASILEHESERPGEVRGAAESDEIRWRLPPLRADGAQGLDIDNETYLFVLNRLHTIGKNMECLPSTHRGKSEEDLRDLLILGLQPHIEGEVTGESFNHGGKTDILVRRGQANVLVAECKMWRGPEYFKSGISQLLRNLTWRDRRAALVLFVRNKGMSQVLQAVPAAAMKHAHYVRSVSEADETIPTYCFRGHHDPGHEVQVSVLAFHLPE